MSMIATIGSFAVGFLLACFFIGEDNKDFYNFCVSVNKWVNKKKNDKKEIKKNK